jgi:hypothetical protein
MKRSMAAYRAQFPQQPIQTLYIDQGVKSRSQPEAWNGLGCKVECFDPLDGIVVPEEARRGFPAGAFAGALGLVQSRARRNRLPIDFTDPKVPVPPNQRLKYLLVAGAAVILLALFVGGFMLYSVQTSALDSERSRLEKAIQDTKQKQLLQVRRNKEQEKKSSETMEQEKALELGGRWDKVQGVILDDLYDLKVKVPDRNHFRFSRLDWTLEITPEQLRDAMGKPGKPSQPLSSLKTQPIGQITFVAVADSPDTLREFRRQLEAGKLWWRIDAWHEEANPDVSETIFKHQVRALLKVYRREPNERQQLLGIDIMIGEEHAARGAVQEASCPPPAWFHRPLLARRDA